MAAFEFQIVHPDRRIVRREHQNLLEIAGVWDHVADLALDVDQPGARIRVIDEAGDTIISVGVATARASASSDRLAA